MRLGYSEMTKTFYLPGNKKTVRKIKLYALAFNDVELRPGFFVVYLLMHSEM